MTDAAAFLRPTPTPSRDSAFFWQGAAQGELLAQQCEGCERFRHPPRPMCPHCGSLAWQAVRLSGRGRVHSWIRPVHPPLPMFEPGFIVALIDLEEGIRLLSNLCGVAPGGSAPDRILNGMPVEVFFERVGADAAVPQFRPVREPVDG